MKYLPLLFLIISYACQYSKVPKNSNNEIISINHSEGTIASKEICWSGTINGKIPILLYYHFENEVIIGKIIYLNTKNKIPIRIIGLVEDDTPMLRLLEFEESGNVTGIISANISDYHFKGTWFSPLNRKELTIELTKKDTLITSSNNCADSNAIYGKYHYQFSEAGYQGDFEIKRISNSKSTFMISSVTNDPARNIAQIDEDTVTVINNQFTYKLANTDDCEFKVMFYKDFAYIKYTKGFCEGQFGNNADIDGLFLKIK